MLNRGAIVLALVALLVGCGETDTERGPSSPAGAVGPRNGADPTLSDWLPQGVGSDSRGGMGPTAPGQVSPHGAGMGPAAPGQVSPHGAGMGGGPAGELPSGPLIEGRVTETMDSGGYTYLNVATATGPMWVATSQRVVEVGSRVRTSGMVMRGFRSNTLNRTFDQLVLASTVEILPTPTPTP